MSDQVLRNALRIEGLHTVAIERVFDALKANHLYVAEHPWVRQEREREERKAEKVAARVVALARAIPYSGRIKECQASKSPARGAPYRCRAKVSLVKRDDYGRGRPMAVCRSCAAEDRGLYTGWGGDPNPTILPVEPEYQPPERA